MKRNTEEKGDDDFDQEADLERRHARGRAVRLFSNFPLLGFIVRLVSNFFGGQLQEALRRRRSFKLALFYQTQMIVGLVGFLLYFVLAISDLAYIKNTSLVSAECSLPDTVTLANGTSLLVYDTSATAVNMDTLHAYAVTNRDVLDCTNDNMTVLDAACTLSEFTTLLYLMLSCAILFLVSALVCQIVASGFKFFSNLPMESLDVDLVSCKVSFLGTACMSFFSPSSDLLFRQIRSVGSSTAHSDHPRVCDSANDSTHGQQPLSRVHEEHPPVPKHVRQLRVLQDSQLQVLLF